MSKKYVHFNSHKDNTFKMIHILGWARPWNNNQSDLAQYHPYYTKTPLCNSPQSHNEEQQHSFDSYIKCQAP